MLARSVAPQRAFTAASSSTARRSVIVQIKPTRAADFRGLDTEELLTKLYDVKAQLARTKYLQATRGANLDPNNREDSTPDAEKVPAVHNNRHLKRQAAQISTLIRERQTADGIGRKDSRKLAKELEIRDGFGRL
jgi:ribosomal protein L29